MRSTAPFDGWGMGNVRVPLASWATWTENRSPTLTVTPGAVGPSWPAHDPELITLPFTLNSYGIPQLVLRPDVDGEPLECDVDVSAVVGALVVLGAVLLHPATASPPATMATSNLLDITTVRRYRPQSGSLRADILACPDMPDVGRYCPKVFRQGHTRVRAPGRLV